MQILIIINIILAVLMIAVILIQQDKSGGAGAALSGGANTMFGSGGSASFLAKVTAGLAVLFFLNSMVLAYMANNANKTAVELIPQAETVQTQETDIPSAASTAILTTDNTAIDNTINAVQNTDIPSSTEDTANTSTDSIE